MLATVLTVNRFNHANTIGEIKFLRKCETLIFNSITQFIAITGMTYPK
jgi:hypothetical protein